MNRHRFLADFNGNNYPTIAKVINRKDGGVFMVIADNVDIYIDGIKASTHQRILKMTSPTEKLEYKYVNGFIYDNEIDYLREKIYEVEKTVRYEVDLVRDKCKSYFMRVWRKYRRANRWG